jgi:hypothetical protein
MDLADEDASATTRTIVEPFVETTNWSEPRPKPEIEPKRPSEVVFVDGTQRILMAGLVEHDGMATSALLASVAVGAVICGEEVELVFEEPDAVRYVLAIAGQTAVPAFEVPCGSMNLLFEPIHPISASEDEPPTTRLILSRYRADVERTVALSHVGHGRLVVMDGRLPLMDATSPAAPIIGLSKSHSVQWLADSEHRLLPTLSAGERTPIFRIPDSERTRLSWYLRLPYTRPIDHSLAGIVRIETPEMPIPVATILADLTTLLLPEFASEPHHDPRAPQNLIPVAALEHYLRHEMGDPQWIERCIDDYLYDL